MVHYEKSRQCSKRSVFDEVAIKLANTGIKIAMVTYIDKKSSRNPRFTGAEPFEKYMMDYRVDYYDEVNSIKVN